MRIEEITQALAPALLLTEVKEHLRIDSTAEDAKLNSLIVAAQRIIEGATDTALISRQFNVYLNGWPTQGLRRQVIPIRPVSEVVSISLVNADDTEIVWPANNYTVQKGLMPSVALRGHVNWPALKRESEGVCIRVTAGFGANWNAVPADIHQALLLLITALYFNRGDAETMPNPLKTSGASALLSPYRRVRL